MANEETYWIPGFREGEVQLTYNDMQWLLAQIVHEKVGKDKQLFEERVEGLKSVLKTRLWTTSEMVRVQGGRFQMGNTWDDREGGDDEPIHEVELTYDYWIGRYPVVFGEYDQYCQEKGLELPEDWGWGRGSRPVIFVGWNDAIGYCNWLSEREGLAVAYDSEGNLLDKNGRRTEDITKVEGYRFPTEAEWEYAARGGHKSVQDYKHAGSDEVGSVGWYLENSGDKRLKRDDSDWDNNRIVENNCRTHPVGEKAANELGMYDMSGNVWEWCSDWHKSYGSNKETNPTGPEAGSERVIRGGSWVSDAPICHVGYRFRDVPTRGNWDRGLRLARTY
ncbi:MAG TPA: SUMF1/EgtB/PvdO family nonheme iron enzyme [Thermotogota bacterium]|nr:SUMF1/EgtB/PvdO family nonheme iron enzyme [Thermotogota bacterium]